LFLSFFCICYSWNNTLICKNSNTMLWIKMSAYWCFVGNYVAPLHNRSYDVFQALLAYDERPQVSFLALTLVRDKLFEVITLSEEASCISNLFFHNILPAWMFNINTLLNSSIVCILLNYYQKCLNRYDKRNIGNINIHE
jgi:hypothetical protein